MPTTISELADKIGIKSTDLKKKITSLGFEMKKNQRYIENDLANLIYDELMSHSNKDKTPSSVETYEEIYEKELEKEIIKKQRKLTAGKDLKTSERNQKKEEEAKIHKELLIHHSIEIPAIITVKELAEKIGISAGRIIGELMKFGTLASINQEIDFDTASIVASELGTKIKKIRKDSSIEDIIEGNVEKMLADEDNADLKPRSPIVCVMGHVDHGKTQLLDYIRNTNIVSKEAGGITQRIGAYEVKKNDKSITFLDTPGHEAFTAMRARGAKVTDIAVLVVAADEGVKPQTIEAVDHAKEAEVPIIVALNKIDKTDINIDRVKAQLADIGLQPEEWGGKTVIEPISALTGEGVNKLLDDILIVAEMCELKANPFRPAVATVIETHIDPNLGPTATIIVNSGTLKIKDNVTVGATYGRIKMIKNAFGEVLKELGPSQTGLIAGFHETPYAGDILQGVKDEKYARKTSEQMKNLIFTRKNKILGLGMEEIISKIQQGKMKTLKVILKTDTNGSLDALRNAISKIRTNDVGIQIIHSNVGKITESDILMASASKAIIIGFNADPNSHVKKLAERENIEILNYAIIYKAVDELQKLLSGLLEPEIVEVVLGHLEVRKLFLIKKKEYILGGKVLDGSIRNKVKFKLKRKDIVLAEGEILSLKVVDDNVHEVSEGKECGLKVSCPLKIEDKDIIEVYAFEKKFR